MPALLRMFSDLHCPYAYLAAWRLRQAMARTDVDVEVRHECLAIEHVEAACTSKPALDAEAPVLAAEAPGLPYQPWRAAAWEWPVTLWPAFEAVKCAQRQGWRQAHELDWRIREAFFGRSLCVSMRHVLLDLAKEVPGLDPARFEEDFDSGAAKRRVIEESREGWEGLDLEVSPTFVLPSGRQVANPAAPRIVLDARTGRVARVEPAPARGEEAVQVYVRLLEEAAGR